MAIAYVELARHEMPPGTNDVEFVFRQVGRVVIDKRLDQIDVGIQGVTDFEPDFRRQGGRFFRRGELVGNHLEALVYEEHERPVQPEEQVWLPEETDPGSLEHDLLWETIHTQRRLQGLRIPKLETVKEIRAKYSVFDH